MSILRTDTDLNRTLSAAWNGKLGAEVKRFFLETDGEDVIEYALLTTFIGFVGAAAWVAIRGSLGGAYSAYNQAVWNLWEPADPVSAGS